MGPEGGSAVSNSVLIACRLAKAQEQFWKSVTEVGETSYRQFLERRALGEGSYRQFFGRESAEPAACEGRLAKENKGKKSIENPSKKVPKVVKSGTLEAPGSLMGATLKKVPIPGAKNSPVLGSFLVPGAII